MKDTRKFIGFAGLQQNPPPAEWDDWKEWDAKAWPKKVERRYELVPTVCFNCEAACGLLAFVDKETGEIRKLEGQPVHPASRGRNCAKGPATAAQLTNPDRILYPLRRVGPRGGGQWERVSWDEALSDIAGRIRKALQENRRDQVVYHVGRPGEDLFTERVLAAWGVDGHNSHTNICSAGGRTGYAFWMGIDRPAPDLSNSRFMLLMSSHLESGHYFNPHAQRIIEAKKAGAKMAVIDTRLSNTASAADYWLAPHPGTEVGLLLAMAHVIIGKRQYNRRFLQRWVNWRQLLEDRDYLDFLVRERFVAALPPSLAAGGEPRFEQFEDLLAELYRRYTPQWAEAETGVRAAVIEEIAGQIVSAGTAFSSHVWRNAAAAHLGGWMVGRALFFLNVLTGAVGTPGGTLPNAWTKFVPKPFNEPPPIKFWNENHFPNEFPLAHFEMSFLLPHILKHRDRRIDVYFTRVYNPVWTNPDGFTWIETLQDEKRIGLHVALAPTWNESAQFADYVLPMGLGPERHDLHSYETHASQWIGFRQPVKRALAEKQGKEVNYTFETNPGEVWEENEFWIDLSWRIDPDGSLGVRKYFESPYQPGQKVSIEEYYRFIFENSVPGLPAAAEREGLTPLQYMRRYGVFEITRDVLNVHEKELGHELREQAQIGDDGGVYVEKAPEKTNLRPYPGPFKDSRGRFRVGVAQDGKMVQGWPTPSGKLEFYSTTLKQWGWPEYALPIYPADEAQRRRMPQLTSQVHPALLDRGNSEFALLPTFRLPTLIHTRTNGAKWLYEISHNNPIWIHPADAARVGVKTGDLAKVETEIGQFVDRVWVTEAIRPGVIACSHHLGRWRLHEDHGSDLWNSAVVRLEKQGDTWRMRQVHGVRPFDSKDPDSRRIWWTEGGVHQNIVFPVQPDPISGAHCWHQKVRVTRATGEDAYAHIEVDTAKAHAVYHRWLKLCRPAPGPGGLRRPIWMLRPLKPHPDHYRLPDTTAAD